jgi:HSP20 family molecular chaperone IbpA
MKIDRTITRQLAQLAKAANLIGGGISALQSHLTETKEGYLLELAMPSLGQEAYRIQVKDNLLSVIATLAISQSTDDEEESPYPPALVRSFPIPHFIDANNIAARFSDGGLKIFAPFNHLGKNFEKDIDIQYS